MKPEDIITEFKQLRPDTPLPEDTTELIQMLFGIIHTLQAEVAELRARLGKDSHNSSKPPSSDGLAKKPVSLRKASGGMPGGQKGHPGRTLKFAIPDTTIQHTPPERSDACGESLALLPNTVVERRQVFDLPPVKPEVAEHQVTATTCTCGKVHRGTFPQDVSAPVQYGPRLKAASVYLTQWQLLPLRRSADLMSHLFATPVSAATVLGAIAEASQALTPAVDNIKAGLLASEVVCFDETGQRVNGRLNWLHSAGTAALIAPISRPSPNRAEMA